LSKFIQMKTPIKTKKTTFGERLSDRIASFGGSWTFIIAFLLFILIWIIINVSWISHSNFDPYPFILLNLILSCVAALQAPVIMMSQNRLENLDRKRAENDYRINLKAEKEIKDLHKKFDQLLSQHKEMLDLLKQKQP
jgi:uncharacterized membrane protein